MRKVYFKIISEHINLEIEPAETEIKTLKEYEIFSKRITLEHLNDLYLSLREVRGDWFSFDVQTNNDNIYATLSLLSAFERENEIIIPAKVVAIVEEFLKPDLLVNLFYPKDSENFIEEIEEESVEESEGILLQIQEHTSFEEIHFIRELKKQNIKFEVINTNFISTDMGAGSYVAGAILYILNAAASGIIWDAINAGYVKVNPFAQNQLDERKIENVNYKKLTRDVSQRAKIKPRELILINMYKKDSERIFEFKANNSIITVICNEDYIIQGFNFEEKETYKQEV